MNPIALIETTAASRNGVHGALATDPVTPTPTAPPPAPRLSTILAAVQRLGLHSHKGNAIRRVESQTSDLPHPG